MMDLTTINVGDVVELNPLMPVLAAEPVVLQAVEVGKGEVLFEATFFGVSLGSVTISKDGGAA